MASALVSGSSGPGSSSGRTHCVVFLGKTLYSHGLSPCTQVHNGVPANDPWGNPARDGLASHQGEGSLHTTETGSYADFDLWLLQNTEIASKLATILGMFINCSILNRLTC